MRTRTRAEVRPRRDGRSGYGPARPSRSEAHPGQAPAVTAGPGSGARAPWTVYLYGLLRAGLAGSSELERSCLGDIGVGGSEVKVLEVIGTPLAVVASLLPQARQLASGDLVAHHEVLNRITNTSPCTVLPMRFGYAAAQVDEVAAQIRARASEYSAILGRLDGRVEVALSLSFEEDPMLAEVVAGMRAGGGRRARAGIGPVPDPARLPPKRMRSTRGQARGGYLEQVELGRSVALAADAWKRAAMGSLLEALDPVVVQSLWRDSGDPVIARCALLVDRRLLDELDRAVRAARGALPSWARLTTVGPIAPYSFAGSSA